MDTEVLSIEGSITMMDEESPFLRDEFNMEDFLLQIIAVARKPRTITLDSHYRRETFRIPLDLVESMRVVPA